MLLVRAASRVGLLRGGLASLRMFTAGTHFEIVELENADDFESLAKSERPLIVDFYG